ncbi:hypothetical protein GCM10007924_09790 [Sneathiella chinensis]|uniref:Transport permease protein n=2 Tax=Sneathiella chinensis TaxID=349750 RepID=A0ABQ5U1Z5_9PROT|nr:hypothetical protein GCM10007924_09790 [Sneathiella chinensis]
MWLAEVYIDLDLEILAEQQLVKLVHIKNKNTNRFGLIKKKFEGVFGRPIKPKSTPADFSYIDWSRISVPDEFVLTEDLIDVKPPRKRGENTLKILFRVVGALMLREMTTRFGRNGLGYLWVVIQQIIFISVFALLFEYRGRSLPYGVSMLAFLITGINAFFIFRNTVSQVRNALKSNISLLYYRQVSPFSIYMSRAVLETLTGIFIFGALVGISVVSGEELRMTSVLQVLGILVMLGLFGTCYGLLMATISTFVPSIKHFEQAINRILFFTSGLFYYANELPQGLREILLWNPLLHLIELLRDGFFATYTAEYASLEYVMWWTAGFLFFALILEIVGRKRMLEA